MAHKKTSNLLATEIERFKKHHAILIDDLSKLIEDQMKINDGWEFLVAVDFSLLYNYIYKGVLSESLDMSNMNIKTYKEIINDSKYYQKRVEIVRAQSVLSFLFEKRSLQKILRTIDAPILLPTYAFELMSFLACKKIDGINITQKINFFKGFGLKLVTDKDDQNEIMNIYNIYSSQGTNVKLSEDDLNKILRVLKKNKMYELLFRIAELNDINKVKTSKLFSEKNIRLEPEELQDYSDIIDDVIESKNSVWQDVLTFIRPDKVVGNYIDAKSMDIIYRINEEFIKKSEKKYLCLFSNATSMDIASNISLYPSYLKELESYKLNLTNEDINKCKNYSYHRRLTCLFMYINAAIKNNNDRIEIIKYLNEKKSSAVEMVNRIDPKAITIINACGQVCSSCLHIVDCKLIKDEISKFFNFKKELEEWNVIALRKNFLAHYKNEIKKIGELDQIAWALTIFLAGDHKALEDLIKENLEEQENKIEIILNQIKNSFIMCYDTISEKVTFTAKMFRRMPYNIIFKNKKISEMYHDLCKLIDEDKDNDEIILTLNKLSDFVNNTNEINIEFDLLRAFLFYLHGTLDDVIGVASKYINKGDFRLVCMYFLAQHQKIIQQKDIRHFPLIRDLSNEMIIKWKKEPIAFYLKAVFLARAIIRGMEPESSINESIICYDMAFKLVYRKRNQSYFKSIILNGKAYLLAFGSNSTELEIIGAYKIIKEIERILPDKFWVARLWDTKGLVYRKYSELFKENKKLNFLKISKQAISKALELAEKEKYQIYETELILANFKETESVINEIIK